jgi:hypothetical protein
MIIRKPNRRFQNQHINSYGAPLFDEAKLTSLFSQIGQLETQEIAESETMFQAAITTAQQQRLATQRARATALQAEMVAESQRMLVMLATPIPANAATISATAVNFATLDNNAMGTFNNFFVKWLKAFQYSDATVSAASQALIVVKNMASFVGGGTVPNQITPGSPHTGIAPDRYPATTNAARTIYAALATLFSATTVDDVYNGLYPKG